MRHMPMPRSVKTSPPHSRNPLNAHSLRPIRIGVVRPRAIRLGSRARERRCQLVVAAVVRQPCGAHGVVLAALGAGFGDGGAAVAVVVIRRERGGVIDVIVLDTQVLGYCCEEGEEAPDCEGYYDQAGEERQDAVRWFGGGEGSGVFQVV